MNLLTMMFPLLCLTAMCLLVANANPTFEGYRYEKPSIAFEYPTVTKMMPKNADIKPTTPTKVASEKIATKSKLNSATATKPTRTMAIATAAHQQEQQQQQEKEKSHEIQKIEKSTVINPTAIKETNLNIKSNKNPATPTKTTTATTETVVKTKTDKLSLNQLPNTISSTSSSTTSSQLASAGCSVFVQQEHTKLKHKFDKHTIKKVDPLLLATQEAALENLLNRDNGYIYRLPTKENQLSSLDEILPHTLHDQHHATKRLKLNHEVIGLDHSHNTASVKYCCEQSFASLKEKFSELSLNRPLERRLAPYQETLADKEYFE